MRASSDEGQRGEVFDGHVHPGCQATSTPCHGARSIVLILESWRSFGPKVARFCRWGAALIQAGCILLTERHMGGCHEHHGDRPLSLRAGVHACSLPEVVQNRDLWTKRAHYEDR